MTYLTKILSTKSVLLVLLLLLAAVVAVPVSATDTPIFSIPEKTSVVFPSEGISTLSMVDYGPLNIPNSFLTSDEINLRALSPETDPSYNLVTFTNPIEVRSDTVNLPITLYGQSYTAILTKSDIDSGMEGMDGYTGTITGLNNSRVILVVTDDNLLTATIQLEDDYLVINPVQNRAYTESTLYPLHVIYSENDLMLPEEPIYFCGTKDPDNSIDQPFVSPFNAFGERSVSALPLDITFVTDSEYYGSAGNWESKAYALLLAADEYFVAGGDLNIILRAQGYDASKRTDLSRSPYKITNPWQAAVDIFPTSYINGKHSDIFVYLGGNDQQYSPPNGETKVGESGFPPTTRIAWVQMVADTDIGDYDGSIHAHTYCFTHELGHIFGAIHDRDTMYWHGQIRVYNVMKDAYINSQSSGFKFAQPAIDSILPYRATVTSYW